MIKFYYWNNWNFQYEIELWNIFFLIRKQIRKSSLTLEMITPLVVSIMEWVQWVVEHLSLLFLPHICVVR